MTSQLQELFIRLFLFIWNTHRFFCTISFIFFVMVMDLVTNRCGLGAFCGNEKGILLLFSFKRGKYFSFLYTAKFLIS